MPVVDYIDDTIVFWKWQNHSNQELVELQGVSAKNI
jgi:hypothetical protein